jgi:hypothetical protein
MNFRLILVIIFDDMKNALIMSDAQLRQVMIEHDT